MSHTKARFTLMTAAALGICACDASTGRISGAGNDAGATTPTGVMSTGAAGAAPAGRVLGTGSGGGAGGASEGGAGASVDSGAAGAPASDPSDHAGDAGTRDDAGATTVVPAPSCSHGLPASIADLAAKSSDDTTSTNTPLGRRYDAVANHVATTQELAFLHDAHAQPVIPGSTSGLQWKAATVTLYPSASVPLPADVNQHAIGNCDGDTAFASLAYLSASFIQRIITDNHDGTFTVAMYDPKGQRLAVSLDAQFLFDGGGNIGEVSGKGGVADWATVLEKATMKYIQVFPVVGDIGGIGSEHQTPMFTGAGGSVAFDRGALAPAELTRVVKAVLAAGKIVSGGFGIENKALANGFETVTAHGYAVLPPKTDAFMIAMRNPWGVEPTAKGYDGSTDGVMDIPPATDWAATIDLRVIDPGDACGSGVTAPYVPPAAATRAREVNIGEPHARALP
ncbi:MAG TPA: C2 family cysteine protease [Polyangia bacterium]|jgi:hypothetical protein|nr:C2 family cysteine protease [Polyangia bacterium]